MNTPAPATTARLTGDAELPDGDNILFVFSLQAPAPASAYDRAAGSLYIDTLSDEPDTPLPSRGLCTVTGRSPTRVDDDDNGAQSADQGSSGLPSHNPSRTGMCTNSIDSPLYYIVMDILDDEYDYKSNGPHRLFISTGSDDTFGFGDDIRKIKARNEHSDMDLEERVPWSHNDISRNPSHTVLPHELNPTLTNGELRRQGFALGRMGYANGAVAHLALLEPRSFVLHCCDWKQERLHQIYLTWRFGVAFGVDIKLFGDLSSGMLGLGPTGIQQAYRQYSAGDATPPS